MKRYKKKKLMDDAQKLMNRSSAEGYLLGGRDLFALGYMAGKYNLERLIDNKKSVMEAIDEYDKTDDLSLLDTVGETLMDLEVVERY